MFLPVLPITIIPSRRQRYPRIGLCQPYTSAENAEADEPNATDSVLVATSIEQARLHVLSNIQSDREFCRLRISKGIFFNKDIQDLLRNKGQDRALIKDYVYDLQTCDLTIITMAGPIHNSFSLFLSSQLTRDGFFTNEERRLVRFSAAGGMPLPHRRANLAAHNKKAASTKYPDTVIQLHTDGLPVWPVVFEIGFSEPYESLLEDVNQWLLGTNSRKPVNIVVILKFHEGRGTPSKKRVRDLFAKYNESAMPDDIEALEYEINNKDWVGSLKAYLEIWELVDGIPERRGKRFNILPKPRHAENPTIRITDIIPPAQRTLLQNFDASRELILDMDQYREELRQAVSQQAYKRALDYILPQDKG